MRVEIGVLFVAVIAIGTFAVRELPPSHADGAVEPSELPIVEWRTGTGGRLVAGAIEAAGSSWVFRRENNAGPYGETLCVAIGPLVNDEGRAARCISAMVVGGPAGVGGTNFASIVAADSSESLSFRSPGIAITPKRATWGAVRGTEDLDVFFEAP
jgi:hypothetical protein